MENLQFLIDVLRQQILIDVEQYNRVLRLGYTDSASEVDEMMKKHFVELLKLSGINIKTIQEEIVETPQVENKNILKLLAKKLNKEIRL